MVFFFSESTILKLLDQAMFNVLLQQLQDTSTTAFETIYYSWRFYEHGSPYELIFSWTNIFKRKSAEVLENYHLHNNLSLLFEEHCIKIKSAFL